MRWSSVLRDDLRVVAQNRWLVLSEHISHSDLGGCSAFDLYDRALLCAYRGRCEGDSASYVQAVEHLNAAAGRVVNRLPSGAFDGLSAIGWTVQHLRAILCAVGVVEDDVGEPTDPLDELEQRLFFRLRRDAWLDGYDLVSGLSGIGLFFLERLPSPAACTGIGLVVDHLEALAETTHSGVTWFTPPTLVPDSQRDQAPDGYYNLGVAHGVPAVIYVLCEFVAADVERSRSEHLLDGAVRWLLAQQQVSPPPSIYPNWIPRTGRAKVSRLAWCYGDLGIAAVLHHVGRRLERRDIRDAARALFDHCLTRSDDCTEPTLCHGALGVAHIFNRVYQGEGDARYLEAANRYYEFGLSLLEATHAHDRAGDDSSRRQSAFLQGDVGAALALLAALYPVEPEWDRRLLLSGCQASARRT